MEPLRIYEDTVYLLNNIIANEKLRYELSINSTFQDNFVEVVNSMLYLEFDEKTLFFDEKYAPVFAKAYANITKQKAEFEKPSKWSIDKTYNAYSKLLSFITTKYGETETSLTTKAIKPNTAEIRLNAKVTDEMREKFKEVEPEIKQAQSSTSEQAKSSSTKNTNNDNAWQNGTGSSNNNYQQQNQYQNMGGNPFMDQAPNNPLRNPRFYPYNKKIKGMKWIRMSIAILLMAMALSYVLFYSLNISQHYYIDTTNGQFKDLFDHWKVATNNNVGTFPSFNYNLLLNSPYAKMSSGVYGILIDAVMGIFVVFWVVYLTWLSPRRVPADYFRVQWSYLFIVGLYALISAADSTSLLSINSAKTLLYNSLFTYFGNVANPTTPFDFKEDFDTLWNGIIDNINYNIVIVFAYISSITLLISLVYIVIGLIINPRMDRNKIMRATQEYQNAVGAMMQGHPYKIDESIYDEELTEIYNKYLKKREDAMNKKRQQDNDKK